MRVDSPFLAAAVVAVAIAMLAIVTARLGRRLRLRGAGVSAVCGLAVAALRRGWCAMCSPSSRWMSRSLHAPGALAKLSD